MQRNIVSARKPKGAALDLVDYLSTGARFRALTQLDLDERFDLGSRADQKLVLDARNDAAHHGLSDPYAALHAIATAEWMLDRLTDALAHPESTIA